MDVLNIWLDVDAGRCVQLVIDFPDIFGMLDADGSDGSGILRLLCRSDAVVDVGAAERNSQLIRRTCVERAGIEYPEGDLVGEGGRTPIGEGGVEKDTDTLIRSVGWRFRQLLLKIDVAAVSAIV